MLHGVSESVGYRVRPIPPGSDGPTRDRLTTQALSTTMILRFALAESLAIISLVAAFAVAGRGLAIYYVGALLSLALMAWHVFPSARPLGRVVAGLERGDVGITPDMRRQLGLDPSIPGLEKL